MRIAHPRDLIPDLAAEARQDFVADVALEKVAHEQRLQARSEELADARYNEDCVYNYASAPDTYKLSCGCRFERHRRKWVFDCPAHD